MKIVSGNEKLNIGSLQKGLVFDLDISSEGLQGTTKFKDKTPYENNGTLSNVTLTTDHKGKANSAGLFNGTSSYINCGNNESLDIVDEITMSAWVKFGSVSREQNIIRKRTSWDTASGYHLVFDYSTVNGIEARGRAGNYARANNAGMVAGEWYHIIGILTKTGLKNKIYINGIDRTVNINTTESLESNSLDLIIGSRSPAGSSYFHGSIERPQIWNRALSADEVKLLYESYNPCLKMTRALKGTFVDSRDGTEYKTIKIGNQTWMAENLKYLPSVVPSATGSETDPYYYVYGYQGTDVATAKATTNYQNYGVLYNWTAATTACPAGWHLPSDAEYKTLEKYLGMTEAEANLTGWRGTTEGVGTKLKSGGSSGFNALMSGYRYTGGSFNNMGSYTHFWSSAASGSSAWRRDLGTSYSTVYRSTSSKASGFSVRCIRDY